MSALDPLVSEHPPTSPARGLRLRRVSRRTFTVAILATLIAPALYLLGRLIRDLTSPSLRLSVEGPFKFDHPAPLAAKETSFMRPDEVVLFDLGSGPRCTVTFEFRGEEHKARQIAVTLTALNSSGQVLFSQTHLCDDQRIYAREQSRYRQGSRFAWIDPRNSESFDIRRIAVQKIAQIELQFREL